MNILAIETSCDETAAAVVENGVKEIASVVASSKDFHEQTGGIVPEVAARKQVEFLLPVLEQTLLKAFGTKSAQDQLDALAVTVGPGLVGSLIVGVEAAKALAFAWHKPLIPVNHLVGHIYANFINDPGIKFPALVLVVSGGHTDLVLMKSHGEFEFIGGTLDDAAGEAFDKTARILGIANYLGGAKLSKVAAACRVNTITGTLPRPLVDSEGYDFSFSGLKTAVKRLWENENLPVEVVAREFEDAVVDVLVAKASKAAQDFKVVSILLGGGVSANGMLRARMQKEADALGVSLYVPPVRLCTDNAVYIASAAFFNQNYPDLSTISPNPSLEITSNF